MIPVLVDVRGRDVSILELVQTPYGLALDSRLPYTYLGTVMRVKVPAKRGSRLVSTWGWESAEYSGVAGSKAGAVEAMLADAGYVQATLEATIPDPLGDWDGSP
jgi:hypothetical protein